MNKFKLTLVIFVLLSSSLFLFAQKDTIRGKIISSITAKTPNNNVFIQEKNTNNIVTADNEGFFALVVDKGKHIYNLEINILGYKTFEYPYKEKWISRKLPKHIVVDANCTISSKKDYKNNELKIFISKEIKPIIMTKQDKRFEKKYKIKYIEFKNELYNYDCVEEYHKKVFQILNIKYRDKWKKNIRKDVVAFNNIENGFIRND